MARTAATYAAVFADFCASTGSPAPGATLSAALLRQFNAAYRAVWNAHPWEDSWADGPLTPTSGLLAYSAVADAHVFNLWSADPRTDTTAVWIDCVTSKDGLYVGTDYTTVYGFWRPTCPQFDGLVPAAEIIYVLRDALLMHAQAEYWRSAGQHATAGQRRKDAQDEIAALIENEFPRLLTKWWLRRKD